MPMIVMSCFLWFKIQNVGIPFLFLAFASLSKLTEQVGGAAHMGIYMNFQAWLQVCKSHLKQRNLNPKSMRPFSKYFLTKTL